MAIVVAGSIDVYRTTTSDLISGEFWGVGHSFGVKNKKYEVYRLFLPGPGHFFALFIYGTRMINLSLPKLCYALGSVFSACVLLLVVVSTINGRLKKFKSLKRNSFKQLQRNRMEPY